MYCIIFRFHGSKTNQRYMNWAGLVTFDTIEQAQAVCNAMLNPHAAEMAIPHYMG